MLLENFRHAESTLCRDRLFSLLGLASDGNESAFEPDCESPLEDVVLKFARVFVRQGRGMQLLYRAGLSSPRFPSWIPDWTVKRPSSLSDASEGGMLFSASGPQQSKIKCIPDTDELAVEGYQVDVIESISESSNLEQEWPSYFREVDEMVDSLGMSPFPCSARDLKWKVPIACAEYPNGAVSGGLDMESSYTVLRRYLVERTAVDDSCSSKVKACSSNYVAVLQDRVKGWRFVVTEKGYTGIVPPGARKGDIVAILKGGRVPFILQKGEERPEAFRLAGECYVHGIMNGEGLSLYEVLEREFRIF
ncbi:hypothetical protein NCS52_01496800 [Fusarium sp. LHS14.1]|nr:hypothetical protein NCS52_01496800 [Fusarium sp. LHS14.1]